MDNTLHLLGIAQKAGRLEVGEEPVGAAARARQARVILLACDAYDVPHWGKDDALQSDASETVFNYLLCAVCPIKEGKVEAMELNDHPISAETVEW